jgi:hypothetical protein
MPNSGDDNRDPEEQEAAARIEAEDTARRAAWRANVAQWEIENRKPWRDRHEFSIGELAEELARPSGQIAAGPRECDSTALYIFEWVVRGECGENDALMIGLGSQVLVPFLPNYRAEFENIRRDLLGGPDSGVKAPALERWPGGAVQVNEGAIILTRRGVRALLEICELPGASRVWRRLGLDAREQDRPEAAASATPAQDEELGGGEGGDQAPSLVSDQVEPRWVEHHRYGFDANSFRSPQFKWEESCIALPWRSVTEQTMDKLGARPGLPFRDLLWIPIRLYAPDADRLWPDEPASPPAQRAMPDTAEPQPLRQRGRRRDKRDRVKENMRKSEYTLNQLEKMGKEALGMTFECSGDTALRALKELKEEASAK